MKKLSILFLSILLIACDANVEYSGATNHSYRNNSDHKVALKAYINGEGDIDFLLKSNEEIVYEHYPSEGEDNPPFSLPRYTWDDSVVTIFDDTLAIMYDQGRLDGNPMRIENYTLLEGEVEPYIYLFEFTNADYERALERGRVIK